MNGQSTHSPEIDYDLLSTLLAQTQPQQLYQKIVSAPFENKVDVVFLFLGFICLYIVDEPSNVVQLVAASGTEEYRLAVQHMQFKASDYTLDFEKDKGNTIVRAIASNKSTHTTDWADLNRGQTPVEQVRLNQANSGIAYTSIYPLQGTLKGAVMYNYYQYPEMIGDEQAAFMTEYTRLVSLSLDAADKATR